MKMKGKVKKHIKVNLNKVLKSNQSGDVNVLEEAGNPINWLERTEGGSRRWGDESEEGTEEDEIESDSGSDSNGVPNTNEELGEQSGQGNEDISVVPETVSKTNGEEGRKAVNSKEKPSYVSFFAGNRLVANGTKLRHFNQNEGPIKIPAAALDEESYEWRQCLVGYFSGKFPGKAALKQVTDDWKVKVSFYLHGSGWLVFKFENENDLMKVLQGGPYLANGSPLVLKIMPKFFKFSNEIITKFPVWIQLRSLPLELWTEQALSMVCSGIGKPIFADQLTTNRTRISYARVLVEVDLSKEVVKQVELVLPGGVCMTQKVFYENLPKICSHCKLVGHTEETCRIRAAELEKDKADANKDRHEENGDLEVQQAPESSGVNQSKVQEPTEVNQGRELATVEERLDVVPPEQQGNNATEPLPPANPGHGTEKRASISQSKAKGAKPKVMGSAVKAKTASIAEGKQKQQSSKGGENQKATVTEEENVEQRIDHQGGANKEGNVQEKSKVKHKVKKKGREHKQNDPVAGEGGGTSTNLPQ